MAHKKGVGSSRNGRDSQPKFLGVKRYGGQFVHLERASRRLMVVVLVALALIFILLYLTYGRMTDVIRIFLTLPLSAIGGIVALTLRDMPFSVSGGTRKPAICG